MKNNIVLMMLGLFAGCALPCIADDGSVSAINGPLSFRQVAPQGFGDIQNSWPWSMEWWNGGLYVGTNRAFGCVKQWELSRSVPIFHYPPGDDLVCTPDPADLPLQAEIWHLDPASFTWTRVYQSPDDLQNPDEPGKPLARDIGYRTMALFTEHNGTQALYVGGVNSQPMWTGKVPAPRILRSTDGLTFTPLPQTTGTFLADVPYSSFRGMISYNGSLFVVNGKAEGEGILIQSSTPDLGDNAWQQVSPPGLNVFETAVFNGYLYVGTFDTKEGFSVWKTDAQGPAPYNFTLVVPPGAYAPGVPGAYAWSMEEFNGQLYVGAGMLILPNPNNCDLIRINPDDSWELVSGTPRQTPNGWLYPISGLPNGFGNEFNDGLWSMRSSHGGLFLGSSDESNSWSILPGLTATLGEQFGFDFFSTPDGVYITQISHNGFDNPLNYGISRMADSPLGLFAGSANVQNGLEIWANDTTPSSFPAPDPLEVELLNDQPLLSWSAVPGAVAYQILRAPIIAYTAYAFLFHDQSYAGSYAEIGSTSGTSFTDTTFQSTGRYLYVVKGVDAQGNPSDPSNLVYAPPLAPPETFTSLLAQVNKLTGRGHFTSPEIAAAVQGTVARASSALTSGDFVGALNTLGQIQRQLEGTELLPSPYNAGLHVSVERLMRRLTLARDHILRTDSSALLIVGDRKQ